MMEGTIIGALGTALGVAAGLGVCALLSAVELDLPADVYFINTLPVVVRTVDVVLVSAAALLISFTATLYPSWEACNMSPLDAIRYD
jgi:lipoprotein-releasing system permease protein